MVEDEEAEIGRNRDVDALLIRRLFVLLQEIPVRISHFGRSTSSTA